MASTPHGPQVDDQPVTGHSRPEERGSAVVPDWKQQLHVLQLKTRAALERLSEYLHLRRPATTDLTASGEMDLHLASTLESLSQRQDSLEAVVQATYQPETETRSARGKSSPETPPAWAVEFHAMISRRLDDFEAMLQSRGERVEVAKPDPDDFGRADPDEDTFIQSDLPDYPSVSPSNSSATADDDSLSVMLGPSLCGVAELQPSIQWLRDNVKGANPQALAFVGQLLVFRCAPADRKPGLLKEVGEAYYRCFPKMQDVGHPFEDAVAAWSRRHCEEAGLPNSIELVHPGERFDSGRHTPVERGGVEVAEVLGWVVLRDGGRVYSKALVQTR